MNNRDDVLWPAEFLLSNETLQPTFQLAWVCQQCGSLEGMLPNRPLRDDKDGFTSSEAQYEKARTKTLGAPKSLSKSQVPFVRIQLAQNCSWNTSFFVKLLFVSSFFLIPQGMFSIACLKWPYWLPLNDYVQRCMPQVESNSKNERVLKELLRNFGVLKFPK